ncbi:MAG: 2,3-bisphosphoglycerate-independent phosphoglycerate mutase [Clostridiales bacterium]
MKKNLVALIILDGFGTNYKEEGNAIKAANLYNIEKIKKENPVSVMHTSGLNVGLPDGQMGNSEVGHTNIGAGRIVYQELTRITKSIEEGSFFEKQEFLAAMDNCIEKNSSLHIYGLVSDGGVHSYNKHLYALVELAKRKGLEKVYIHCFLDGRDVPPNSGKRYVEELSNKLKDIGVGKIASVMGRYYSMDRDKRWDRVKLAYNAMVKGEGLYSTDGVKAVADSYERDEFDEFVKPTVITENNKPIATINENDSIIFFNFRPDRAREITRAIIDKEFDGFKRDNLNTHYVTMTQYDKTLENVSVAFKPEKLNNTFAEFISKKGLKQLRIAETEKYAHVTFFFNGGIETLYEGEDRALIKSPDVATYDLKPEMSAYEVTDEVIKRIESEKYDVIILNYANPDMVGHTGYFDAAVKAIETVDICLGRVVEAIQKQNGVALITADHGNVEQMIDYDNGGPFTAHTTNDVPLIGVGLGNMKLKDGKLADLAPTLLELLELKKPKEMTGESLLLK